MGPLKGLVPLMTVVQHKKGKVHTVMDYLKLNEDVCLFPTNEDVCSAKLREWHQQGENAAILDLRKAYRLVHVHESLRPYPTAISPNTVEIRPKRGTLVMKSIIDTMRSQTESMRRATSVYIDDVYVNESIESRDTLKRIDSMLPMSEVDENVYNVKDTVWAKDPHRRRATFAKGRISLSRRNALPCRRRPLYFPELTIFNNYRR